MNESSRSLFLPDLCGYRALFGVLIIGELLTFVLVMARKGVGTTAFDDLALLSLYVQLIGLGAAAALCLSRGWLQQLPEKIAAVSSYIIVMVVVLAVAEAAWYLVNPVVGAGAIIGLQHQDFLARTLGISAIVAAATLRYFYVQHHWKQRTASEARARLDALQARIRPHFLFNCMNTIASLTRSDAASAERAVEDLSELLRVPLSEGPRLVKLNEELDLARRYLAIEKLRLGDRLSIAWQVDDRALVAELPPLTLQPLVENAIYHGVEQLTEGGTIAIKVARHGDRVVIEIVNPVPSSGPKSSGGNRVAQENVRLRLQANFATQGLLEVFAEETSYRVVVQIPAHAQEHR